MADYLYAVALARSGGHQEKAAAAEAHLGAAINLDPRLGNAYLQLGILRSQRGDDGAIIAFQSRNDAAPRRSSLLPRGHLPAQGREGKSGEGNRVAQAMLRPKAAGSRAGAPRNPTICLHAKKSERAPAVRT
jgi:hypothetical protein